MGVAQKINKSPTTTNPWLEIKGTHSTALKKALHTVLQACKQRKVAPGKGKLLHMICTMCCSGKQNTSTTVDMWTLVRSWAEAKTFSIRGKRKL